MPKMAFWALTGILLGALTGCGQEGSHQPGSAPSVGSEIRFRVPFAPIAGLTATLEISGVGTYPMMVNADGTVSVTVPGIPAGWRTFTVTYYANGVILARATTGAEVIAGQTITVSFLPQDLDRNFDSDGDGWVNLAELLWGTEPLSAASVPGGERPPSTVVAGGGLGQSASYRLEDTIGKAIEGGESSGGAYTLR